ncbi:phospholipid phosphatase 2 [Aplysia californica]|uniref:Phospholipid phosphatase 2 n=1 Tax=Aplysia californica TaxID=6500 RepID=A0ABM0JBY8_APLCA|nr:phospholipid phosphatase 2 [Aplysia californica]
MVCLKNQHLSQRRGIIYQIISDIFCVILVGCGILAIKFGAKPYHRGFFCGDESIMHPVLSDTVSIALAASVGVLLPGVVILLCEFILRHNQEVCLIAPKTAYPRRKSWWLSAYRSLIVFVFGISVTQFLTEIGKYSIGRLRPHFLTLCKPNLSLANCADFVIDDVCTSTDSAMMTEARLSFPSGHSSFSMYCMLFLVLYMQGRLLIPKALLLKPVAQLVVFSLGFFTCLSRISDYKHHWSDVLAGAILGMTVSVIVVVSLTDFGKTLTGRTPSSTSPDSLPESPPNMTVHSDNHSSLDYPHSHPRQTSPPRDPTSKTHIVQVEL